MKSVMKRTAKRVKALDVRPALLHDGRHPLLVLPLVFLIELCGLTVGWAVGVWLIQQRLQQEKLFITPRNRIQCRQAVWKMQKKGTHLDGSEYGRDVICGAPAVLENV